MTISSAAESLARADNFKPADEVLSADILAWWNENYRGQWVRSGLRGGVVSVCDLGEYERRINRVIEALA